jgi:hypothetical protein
MADVWLAKDVAPAGTEKTTVALGDVLAAPSTDLLPGGSAATQAAADVAANTARNSLIDRRHFNDDDFKQVPLI